MESDLWENDENAYKIYFSITTMKTKLKISIIILSAIVSVSLTSIYGKTNNEKNNMENEKTQNTDSCLTVENFELVKNFIMNKGEVIENIFFYSPVETLTSMKYLPKENKIIIYYNLLYNISYNIVNDNSKILIINEFTNAMNSPRDVEHFCQIAEKSKQHKKYINIVINIAKEIELLKKDFPQLREFELSKNINKRNCKIDYKYKCHKSERKGGWTSGVPNPGPDGLWFYIALWDENFPAESISQINPDIWEIQDRRVTYIILEGENTKQINKEIIRILEKHKMKTNYYKTIFKQTIQNVKNDILEIKNDYPQLVEFTGKLLNDYALQYHYNYTESKIAEPKILKNGNKIVFWI
jgi:hypothetical protein